MRTLTPEEARSFYDRFGIKQDSQAFYESRAIDELLANGHFEEAESVFEFGCGTGSLALKLLSKHLSTRARYQGLDISTTMVRIASDRLAPFAARASVQQAPAEPRIPLPDVSVDRFVSTYVFDLLADSTARQVLSEAKRILRPGGLICLAGITHGKSLHSRIIMSLWQWLFKINPSRVGGCRPTSLTHLISASDWQIQFHDVVVAWGVASEVLIAAAIGKPGTRT